MDTKKIPALIVLLGCAAACIVTYLEHYTLKEMLTVLIIVLVVFLVIGLIVKSILDKIRLPEDGEVGPDGEVVEKTEEEGSAENSEEGNVGNENSSGAI